jgi:polysaccharide export outer membrane protein
MKIIQGCFLTWRKGCFCDFFFNSLFLISCFFIAQQACLAAETEKPSPIVQSGQETYTIGSGDILAILTWKEPDFTLEEVQVRTDGKISFPLLNDIQAAGLTPTALKQNIEKGLQDYVDSPFVTVGVKDPQSKKFYILGEVNTTGEFPLLKNLTILQAFAIAGGFTEWASKKEILLLRKENGKEKFYRINYKKIIKGKDIEQNMEIRADDTIIVP